MSELVRIENDIYKDLKDYCECHPLRPKLIAVVSEAVRQFIQAERQNERPAG